MKNQNYLLILILCISSASGLFAQKKHSNFKIDSLIAVRNAEVAVNKFMNGLNNKNVESGDAQIQQVMHKCNFDSTVERLSVKMRDSLLTTRKSTSKLQSPANIIRVEHAGEVNLGRPGKKGIEKGELVRVYLANKPGVRGRNKFVTVFIPANGSEAKIANLRGLE